MRLFPRQSRSCGGGIPTTYVSILGFSITLKTNFDFTHTSFEVVPTSITLQHNTLLFFIVVHPTDKTILLTMFTEQLPDHLGCINNLPGLACLVSDMNINLDNQLRSPAKHFDHS